MEAKGFLTPENRTVAGTRYYGKQQIKNFKYLYSLYVDHCRKEAMKKKEDVLPTVRIDGMPLPELKPLIEDLENTKSYNENTFTVNVIEPTCTTKGYTEHVCNENRLKSYKDNEVAALGHDYTQETIEPTCEKEGEEHYTCNRCNHSYTKKLKALMHKFIVNRTEAPTCTMDGIEVKTCEHCNETKEIVLSKLGHEFTETIVQEGSCTESKITKKVCSRCSEEIVDETPATGHDFNIETIVPTCDHEGYDIQTCKVCGFEEKINIVPQLAHTFTEEITVEATEDHSGCKTLTCSLCGYEKTETIPQLEPKTASMDDFLSQLEAMQSENTKEVEKGEEEARLQQEQLNSYTGPMTVQGKKRKF